MPPEILHYKVSLVPPTYLAQHPQHLEPSLGSGSLVRLTTPAPGQSMSSHGSNYSVTEASDNDVSPPNTLDHGYQYFAEDVRRRTKPPDTAEIDVDENPSLPYDPNLVCPKCGKRFHIGEIQKFKRHVLETCPNRDPADSKY